MVGASDEGPGASSARSRQSRRDGPPGELSLHLRDTDEILDHDAAAERSRRVEEEVERNPRLRRAVEDLRRIAEAADKPRDPQPSERREHVEVAVPATSSAQPAVQASASKVELGELEREPERADEFTDEEGGGDVAGALHPAEPTGPTLQGTSKERQALDEQMRQQGVAPHDPEKPRRNVTGTLRIHRGRDEEPLARDEVAAVARPPAARRVWLWAVLATGILVVGLLWLLWWPPDGRARPGPALGRTGAPDEPSAVAATATPPVATSVVPTGTSSDRSATPTASRETATPAEVTSSAAPGSTSSSPLSRTAPPPTATTTTTATPTPTATSTRSGSTTTGRIY